MKIYTKSGDKGQTSLLSGERVSKSDPHMECVGALDELNSSLGIVLSDRRLHSPVRESLVRIQKELFFVGAELALSKEKFDDVVSKISTLSTGAPAVLEGEIDSLDSDLPELKSFILPGGSVAGARLHFARNVCRRTERSLQALNSDQPVRPHILEYVNRLSDYLFVAARWVNQKEGISEILWDPKEAP